MTFGLMAIGFVAVANPGRVAQAGPQHGRLRALALGAVLVAVCASVASSLLDGLDISPESFRIAAGIVLGATALRRFLWPGFSGPFPAVLLTPDLAYLALTLGADEHQWKVFLAAACALPFVAAAMRRRPRMTAEAWALAFASLEVLVAVVLVIHGIRDV